MNAIVVPAAFQQQQLAPAFQNQQSGDDLSGGITGGYGLIGYRGKVWSIRYQGNNQNLMNDAGDGPRPTIEVIIVKANPHLSKTWYEKGFEEGSDAPPDCASANGIFPDPGVPKKQSEVCAQCPRNMWGTAPNGGKGKACGDHRRMAAVPATDIDNEMFGGPMLLRCPAASLQDLMAFDARYKAMGYPYYSMVVKIGFDVQESYPKFVFTGVRPLTNDEAVRVLALRDDPRVARVISEAEITAKPAPQLAAPAPAFEQPIPANAVAPQPPAPAPVQSAPQVAPAAPPPPPVTAAPPPVAPAASPATTGGFGPTSAPLPAQAAQQAPQPATRAMTGFGPATGAPPVTPASNQTPLPAAPSPVAQPVQTPVPPAPSPVVQATPAFEADLDDRLAALLGAANAGAAKG